MAGSLKNFVYTTNNGSEFIVRLDESNAELTGAGFRDMVDADANLLALPKNVKMRYVNVVNAATNATRKIFCGTSSAAAFLNGGVFLLALITSATAGSLLPFRVLSAVGEVVGLLNPNDTGLTDGDQD